MSAGRFTGRVEMECRCAEGDRCTRPGHDRKASERATKRRTPKADPSTIEVPRVFAPVIMRALMGSGEGEAAAIAEWLRVTCNNPDLDEE